MRALIRKIHQEYLSVVVFVTHDIGEAFSLSDRILVLEAGRVVELGTPAQLIAHPQSQLLRSFLCTCDHSAEIGDITQ